MAMSPSAPSVGFDELLALHEHASRAAARVVHPALVRGKHLHQQLHHAPRRVELAALLALGARELGQEVLVDAAQDVLGAVLGVAQPDGAYEVNKLAKTPLVQVGPRVVLGQHALEAHVVALDSGHRIVHQLANGGLLRVLLEVVPSRLRRHPEDIVSPVLVRVLRVCSLSLLGNEFRVALLESVRNIFEEDEPEDDVLVLRCVHAAAELVRRFPHLGFKTEGRAVCTSISAISLFLSCHLSTSQLFIHYMLMTLCSE